METIKNSTKIEMLCELAHNRVLEEAKDKYDSNNDCYSDYIKENDGDGQYTEDGQELFNEYYDYYESIILDYLKEVE